MNYIYYAEKCPKGDCPMYSRKKVLVVEDNMLNRELLCGILATEYEVLEAENGQEALETVRRYKEGISIILLDIVMPVMDGYTFLSIVKADAELSSIPVIVATQSDGESDEVTVTFLSLSKMTLPDIVAIFLLLYIK
jgi:CheY-like chemotaxis protein